MTLFLGISVILNSRPLMMKATDDQASGGPLTPLHLLMGRVSVQVPEFKMEARPTLTKSTKFMEEVRREIWSKQIAQVFPKLVPSHKWRTCQRNLMPGDLVFMKHKTEVLRKFCLATVEVADPNPIHAKNSNCTGDIMKNVLFTIFSLSLSPSLSCAL